TRSPSSVSSSAPRAMVREPSERISTTSRATTGGSSLRTGGFASSLMGLSATALLSRRKSLFDQPCNLREIGKKAFALAAARVVIGRAQHCRRMHRGHEERRERIALDGDAALLGYLEVAPEQRLRGGRAETDDDAGLHQGNLGVQPGAAGGDL